MYRDRLHLLSSGKSFLSNRLIENINDYLEMHTHHQHVPIQIPLFLDHSCFSDLKAFRKCKLQHPKNPVTGYLNVNSPRNKIVGLREIMSDIHWVKMFVFGVILVRIFTHPDWIQNLYSVRMRKNADKNNSEYGHFLHSDISGLLWS